MLEACLKIYFWKGKDFGKARKTAAGLLNNIAR
jgi:hypothetical protein